MILERKLRPVRTGKIKIGDTVASEVNRGGHTVSISRPVGLDYFRIVGGEFAVHQKYGEQPKSLAVYLDELSEYTWDVNYKRYGSSALLCKGDGLVGYEAVENGLKERDCALRGCPYAAGDRPSCRMIGLLNLKIVGVPSVGVYTLEFKSEWAIDRVEAFLRGLSEAAGGNLAGIPFAIEVKRVKGNKGIFSTVELVETEETGKALVNQRLPTHLALEEATSLIITDSRGQNIASPQLTTHQDIEVFQELAFTIQEGIDKGCFTPKGEESYLRMLQSLGQLSNQEARHKTLALKRWLEEYENTKDQQLTYHPKELAAAKAAGLMDADNLSRGELRSRLRELKEDHA